MTRPWVGIAFTLFFGFGIAAVVVQDMPASGVLGLLAVLSLLLLERD